jgi:hypothetical protein
MLSSKKFIPIREILLTTARRLSTIGRLGVVETVLEFFENDRLTFYRNDV